MFLFERLPSHILYQLTAFIIHCRAHLRPRFVQATLANAIVYISERQLPGHVAREEQSRNREKTVIKNHASSLMTSLVINVMSFTISHQRTVKLCIKGERFFFFFFITCAMEIRKLFNISKFIINLKFLFLS